MAYKMTKEYDPKRDGPKVPGGMTKPGKPMKPGMKPGVSTLPAGMVNKPAMNKSPMQEAIRRMRGNK
jgi:hypothetical protein